MPKSTWHLSHPLPALANPSATPLLQWPNGSKQEQQEQQKIMIIINHNDEEKRRRRRKKKKKEEKTKEEEEEGYQCLPTSIAPHCPLCPPCPLHCPPKRRSFSVRQVLVLSQVMRSIKWSQ
jgi:hypothetical protein